MSVRIGVDVGGTFTKAVACDATTQAVVARSIVPTSHDHTDGVADGVARAVEAVAAQVAAAGIGPITSVAHSTTQAVNALLEGDTARVGVLGLGRRPDLGRVRRRTSVGAIALAPGRRLETISGFLDVTDGVRASELEAVLGRLRDQGAEAIAISEAFSVDDTATESLALEAATRLGIPACAGHELTGLYGLEMRTVTAALNAGILPRALATARVVDAAVRRVAPGAPLLVMRGDGGAADLRTMSRHPLLTAFSGPAASVAGALRHSGLLDGVVLEVGGTSTNISVVKEGRPVLAYVRVLDHLTCVRSLDVRVAGIGGGSLLRIERRWGRPRVADVGPRSAHIAGLPYAAFVDPERLAGAEAHLIAPRPGDPEQYAVLSAPGGERFAITLTCAANAVDAIPDGAYATGNAESARLAFAALGRLVGQPGERLALQVLEIAAGKVTPIVDDLLAEHRLARPELVGAGGGAGALLPEVARRRRLPWRIPPDAEVISSVGDALSLVRVELERVMARPSAESVLELHRAAERAAVEAGADPETLQVESESEPERRILRVVAHGALAIPGAAVAAFDADEIRRRARERIGHDARLAVTIGPHHVFVTGEGDRHRFVVVDERGPIDAEGEGRVITGQGTALPDDVRRAVDATSRHLGPIAVAPVLRVLRGARLVDLSLLSDPGQVLAAALDECAMAADTPVAVIVSRA
jgi:N-methylhydantoinase A/oxoprolinase/acetone carboxylase beta subunit